MIANEYEENAMTMPNSTTPTSYEQVNTLLHLLFTRVQAILGNQLIGFYLYGSLSLGDFDPASSDVDFLVATEGDLSDAMFEALREMHESIAESGLPYAKWLEGSYIPRDALRKYDPKNALHPTIGVDWSFTIGLHKSNWIIERYIVREHGVILFGPSPETLIDLISIIELRDAVCKQLSNYWEFQLDDPEWLRSRHYQAFARLTMCRALYVLQNGTVPSKPQAATWGQENLDAKWRPIIEKALIWRTQHDDDDLTETLDFMRYALAQAHLICGDSS